MKRSELQVGVEYAYRESIYRDVHRVKIVALDAPRGGIGYKKDTRDAIEIEYVGEQPSRRFPTHHQPKAGDRWTVVDAQPGRLFLAPWEQYVATEAENQRAEEARRVAEERQQANANAIRAALGLAEEADGWDSSVRIDAPHYPAVARRLGISLPFLPEAASHAD